MCVMRHKRTDNARWEAARGTAKPMCCIRMVSDQLIIDEIKQKTGAS